MGKHLEQQYEEREYALELAKKHNLLPEDNSNMTWEELKKKAKEIFCCHDYRYIGIDYTHTPYIYIIRCKKCEKTKYLFGKEPKCKKVPNKEFCAIDNPVTALLRKNGYLPKCKSCTCNWDRL